MRILESYYLDLLMRTKLFRFLMRTITATIVVSLVFVITQDIHVFPAAVNSIFSAHPVAPNDVESISLSTPDGETIVVWRVEATSHKRNQIALLFHGNGETLANTVHMQRWFRSLGFSSYALDYRGFGASSGWPSESGIYTDAETTINLVLQREQIAPRDLILFGSSLGTGPAAYVAEKYTAGTLVLLAPYTSLREVAREMPLFGYLSPFLWTTFPTKDYIQRLSQTCVVAAHGKYDSTIPYHHSLALKNAYNGARSFSLLLSDSAGHNDLFSSTHADVAKAIDSCIATTRSSSES